MTVATSELPNSSILAETLVDLAQAATQGAETIELFTSLTERCVELLPVAAAGILLRDVNGKLQVIGASNPSAHLLDLFQLQNQEGPCLECCAIGEAVVDIELSDVGKWPEFAEKVRSSGFRAVYALPLRSRGVTVGALNLFATTKLDESHLTVAQALADAATLSLMQVDPELDLQIVIRSIHLAVESRNTVEQAQGMIAERYSISAEDALVKIRKASKETGLSLLQTAIAVVEREPSFKAL